MYGCDHCIKARKLKIEMGTVGNKLGQIRGAITRAGRKLNNNQRTKRLTQERRI